MEELIKYANPDYRLMEVKTTESVSVATLYVEPVARSGNAKRATIDVTSKTTMLSSSISEVGPDWIYHNDGHRISDTFFGASNRQLGNTSTLIR